MTSWGCRLLQVKWPACMRHQMKASIPTGMLKQRDLPSPSLMGRQEVAHQTSPPTVPEPGKPRGALRITCEGGTAHTLGPQITGGHGVLPPTLRHPSLYPDCKVLHLLGLLWLLTELEGHSLLFLLTRKPGSRAPRTAGR